MTDTDALALRRLITIYTLPKVLLELTRIVTAYSRTSVRWCPVRDMLKKALYIANGKPGRIA